MNTLPLFMVIVAWLFSACLGSGLSLLVVMLCCCRVICSLFCSDLVALCRRCSLLSGCVLPVDLLAGRVPLACCDVCCLVIFYLVFSLMLVGCLVLVVLLVLLWGA